MHEYLVTSFPLASTALAREVVGALSLLYTWPGADPSLPPVVLPGAGHFFHGALPTPTQTVTGSWPGDGANP